MNYTLFSDFTCVECYALNEFLVARGTAADARWKWVQGQPSLPPLMTLFHYRARAEISASVHGSDRDDCRALVGYQPGKIL